MVDTFYGGSGETPLKIDVAGESEISESAVTLITREDESNFEHEDKIMHSSRSVVPQIVIVDTVSGSFSNVKDISSSNKSSKRRDKKNRRKDQDMRASVPIIEGQRAEVGNSEAAAISSEPRLTETGWFNSSLAKASKAFDKHTAMERADISPYSSDEWEADSVDSDTSDDHTDSSDDDDPKSQVDRLIERGTLIYMEGENSALSSEEDESDDEYDSESDITDVSPLVSAAASPLGLSPVLPRRQIATSPLALHSNSGFPDFDCTPELDCWNNLHRDFNDHMNQRSSDNTLSMDPLLRAVVELEQNRNRAKFNLNHHNKCNSKNTALPGNQSNDQMFIHPIRDNPHHLHLRKNCSRRKNMSFSNEEVRKIDRDNKILLKKIMAAHHRAKPTLGSPQMATDRAYQKPSNSSVNRKRGDEKIRRENVLLLKKIQEAKPSKEVVESRITPIGGIEPLLSSVGVPNHSLRSPTNSCGAFMRSISQSPHVSVPPPRKETAL